nr:unnamed protein product [Digitaria exilis]
MRWTWTVAPVSLRRPAKTWTTAYLSSSLRVAIRGGLASPGRRCEELKLITEEAGVLRAVWNAGDDPADSS